MAESTKKHVVAINHVLKTQARRYVASLEQVNDAPMASPSWIWLIGAPDPNTTQLVARRTVMPERARIAPVITATASFMLIVFGFSTAARLPSRATWMRSATSNTCGMLWLIITSTLAAVLSMAGIAAAAGQPVIGLITKTETNPFFVKMKTC